MNLKFRINKIISVLLWSDILFYTGWGLISPILAVFITKNIEGGSVAVVGWTTAIYWITFSFFRVPFGMFLDKKEGERDDYWFLVWGLFMASLVPFGFMFARFAWQIYLLQFAHGLGMAMSLAGWSAIFNRHIDKSMESTEYGLSSSSVALTTAISAIIGGYAVESWGFGPVMALVGIFGLVGAAILLMIEQEFKGDFRPYEYLSRLCTTDFWQRFLEKSAEIRIKNGGNIKDE